MVFSLSKNGHPLFSRIHPLLAGSLRSVSEDPWEHYPEGSSRLLPPPGDDGMLLEDWNDLVQPELRRHFDSERAVVAADILAMKQSRGKQGLWSLEIPKDHTDAWLTTLNALRLALAGEYGFSEGELSPKNPPDLSCARGLALMQVNFYAFIQECLIHSLQDMEGEQMNGKDRSAE